ncbi:MAG: large-conductance mechanosensitive channel protein MscL [Bacteroidaceae bacterium]|nr:large-conductance mechanosensitive channel protein MscL [Bacteroidaceae bacterium]
MAKSTFLQDFKAFAMKGNVVDMAVGVIIGGAFGKIVTALVNDIIMPSVGLLIGGINFKDLKVILSPEVLNAAGEVEKEAVTLNYGNFLQQTFDFIIIAFSIFLVIRLITKMTTKKEEEPAPAPAPAPAPEPSAEEKLLTEIRDLLKEKK